MARVLLLLCLLATAAPVRAQEPAAPPPAERPDPQAALRRALIVPGGGQFYNRQPLKAAVFYAGVGGIAALFVHSNSQYHHYQHVFRYAERPADFPQYAEEAAPYSGLIASGGKARLRMAREKARRNRDLSAVGGGLWYALSVLDAYVSAHLRDFDTDERLSVHLTPAPEGPSLRLTLSIP